MNQQPATRGWVRRGFIEKGLKFPQDLNIGQQVYARHPASGEYCLVSLIDFCNSAICADNFNFFI
jgi:hypothetical protein